MINHDAHPKREAERSRGPREQRTDGADMTAQSERTAALPGVQPGPVARRSRHQRRHSTAFWVVAAAFCVNLAFSAVPTPLYVIYQQRDHFSTLMITVVYAVYAVGVMVSLFLGGHVSDWVGRRQVLVPALAVNVASAVLFIAFPSLAGLIIARVVSGVSIGLTTGTATAYLAELHLGAGGSPTGRRPQVVATAANLGGIGVGPLGAGLLAQFAPLPLVIPYVIFGGVLVALATLAKVPVNVADRLLGGERPDPVLILCRAIGLNWSTVKAIIMLRPDAKSTSHDSAFANYERLSNSTARRVVRFWQVRQAG